MDIHENEEQLEELEPLEVAAETAAESSDELPAAAAEELVDSPDQESPADDQQEGEESQDEQHSGERAEEQISAELDEETELVLDESEEQLLDDEIGGASESVVKKGSDPEYPDPYRTKPVAEPAKDDGRVWYVVHCYSGNEDKVRHNIMQRIESMSMDDLIFDVVVPTEDEVNIKNGERQTVEKKVFPGYILVNMILTEESWYMVRNTPGVTGFVGMGNDPTPLQPEEVARILKRMESESPRINVTFRPGERVRIVDGPFEDFYGKVSEIDMDRATVRVMVNFFGRETPVELDFLQVEEA
jgi:transcriptional antiterminator NusG